MIQLCHKNDAINNMTKSTILNKRQEIILAFLEENKNPLAIAQIILKVDSSFKKTARITVIRDLNLLVKHGYITQYGKGRGVVYQLSVVYRSIKPIDIESYFKIDPDKREIQKNFNFEVFALLKNIFNKEELAKLQMLNKIYQKNIKKLSPTALKREFERLVIELSWKSSKIEGNTYTLLETEYLLREQKEPKGHSKEEATMILNHKKALDFIRSHPAQFKKLSVPKIEDVHYLLTKDLSVARNIRQRQVRISGTAYTPLDNQFQIREAVQKMCEFVNNQKNQFEKAFVAMLLIAYIQPFEDGNKRTSRVLGNAVLLALESCPLSFRSIDELEYKKAILLFYEQNNFSYFKELFINQFEFAVDNYFG
ncbi:MAG: hypothetical protein US58_C0024G0007 [Candidatus Magasanikbacteria bacterium GW2011_GWA2_37_8]|uniref:Fido domain-containing protein n=1 Tax=Candidatus Magasanikbacteria bacterium GW2011_GWA2_37_8 TaxID=1619036 RepID=A0A0G0KHG8_9BACT|nr:MAG: hypothetical protein US58_C0024G0007 [Candidatus Magasanikbacteria bacterium GW2011_GWA2_37_8]